MNFKLTPWFDGDVKPVYPGVYERNFAKKSMKDFDTAYCLYDGKLWKVWEDTPELANKATTNSYIQELPWRGIFKDEV